MILIDDNQAQFDERQGYDLIEILETEEKVLITELEFGDLAFTGRVNDEKIRIGMEFKWYPNDVMASLRDGRIPKQLIGMVNTFDISYLCLLGEDPEINFKTGKIIEKNGKSKRREDSPYSWHYLNSFYMRFEAAGGHILKCRDMQHLAVTILSYYRAWNKDEHQEEMFLKTKRSFISWSQLDNSLANFYAEMVSPRRALALTEYYPIPWTLLLADEDSIAKVQVPKKKGKGFQNFGRINARKVYSFLHKDHGTGTKGKEATIGLS